MSVFGVPHDPENGWSAFEYARHICALLSHLLKAATEVDEDSTIRRRHPFVITADANGDATERIMLPAGVAWTLMSFAYQCTTDPAGTGYLAFYQDQEGGDALLKKSDAALVTDGNFAADGDRIPEQSSLVIVAHGLPAGTVVSGNLRAKGIQSAPVAETAEEGGDY